MKGTDSGQSLRPRGRYRNLVRFAEGMRMDVLSLVWVGTRTSEYAATVTFFRDVLGLAVQVSELDFAVLDVPGGATVEVFGPASEFNPHLTHPVAGFRVADLDEAVAELRAAGVEIVQDVQGGDARSWVHFRAPDGFVYELVEAREELPSSQ